MIESPSETMNNVDVPVLDLAPLLAGDDLTALAAELRNACLNTGFFYVANHGVPQALVDNIFAAAKRFFDLPEATRREILVDERFRRGYVPFGSSTIPGFKPDMKERFDWGVDTPLDDPFVVARKPLYGPNKWPQDMPWFRRPAEEFAAAMTQLGMRLLRVIALSLGMPEDHFQGMFGKSCITHNMIHYPPQVATDGLQNGASEHTDYGLLTLLAQDPIGGLEVRRRNGEWIAAPYIPGTFVVNIADLFKVWTNDIYVSNLHRVVNRSGRERYSFPTFINTDYDVLVETLPTCITTDRPRKHEPIKSGDYLLSRFRTIQNYKI
ncbi:2-oxoglutarate and iron-dependent oxygenase domain-containing protein [soil metagenome]